MTQPRPNSHPKTKQPVSPLPPFKSPVPGNRFPVTGYQLPLLFLLTFLTVFTLYVLSLAPGLVGGDAGEHQLAAPLLGIPHTTGYPLYILAGKLWTLLLPVGSLAWRMNLFSALGGALAAATTTLVVYYLANEIRRPPAAGRDPAQPVWAGPIVAGLVLACGLTLWQWSTIAGVRSFNVFFFALLTLEAIIWRRQRLRGDTQAADRTLGWLALTVGLSLAHHRTTVFYLPLLIGWLWQHDRQLVRRPRRLLRPVLLILAPLSLYLFIYLRGVAGPPYSHERITDLASFWFLVGSGDSTGLFLSLDPAFLPARLAFIWRDLLHQLAWPGVILAILGGLRLARRGRPHFLLQASLVLLLLLFTLDFEVVNLTEAPTWYLMPAYFVFAVWLGLGLEGILEFGFTKAPLTPAGWPPSIFRRNIHRSGQRAAEKKVEESHFPPRVGSGNLKRAGRCALQPASYGLARYHLAQLILAAIALAVFGYTLAWPNWRMQYAAAASPLDDWRQLLRGMQAQRLVESSLPYLEPNSIIWGDWEQYTPFKYYQLINGVRPDITVRNPLDRWPEKAAAAHEAGRPLYFTRKPPDLLGRPYLSMAGPLIHLGLAPQFEAPADIVPLAAHFEDQLELVGYRVVARPQKAMAGLPPAGPVLQVMLYWRVPQKVTWDYALSLRLLDAEGRTVHKQDAAHPVLGSYPTSLWTPGEVVGDFYELPLPARAGPLMLHILPYRTEEPGQWYNLTLNETQPAQEGIFLGPF